MAIAGAAGSGVLSFTVLWLLYRFRRKLALKRLPITRRFATITLQPDTVATRNCARRNCAGSQQASAARAPNRWSSSNVGATVEATARAGGFVTPAFAPRLATPEYLVLIDRRGAEDHLAHASHGLAAPVP